MSAVKGTWDEQHKVAAQLHKLPSSQHIYVKFGGLKAAIAAAEAYQVKQASPGAVIDLNKPSRRRAA